MARKHAQIETATQAPQTSVIPSNEIRKHIAAVHMGGDLSFLERTLINILLLNAYDDSMNGDATHVIPVPFLLAMIGWQDSHRIPITLRS